MFPATRPVKVGNLVVGGDAPLALIAGPCVIESLDLLMEAAERLIGLCGGLGVPLVFKSSYDKANRSSHKSYRGPGIIMGLEMLAKVKERFKVPVLSDVHSVEEVEQAAEVLDVIQIPAFLCRQTDLVMAAAETGLPVNVKKGQFMAPADMVNVMKKVESKGNRRLMFTERGTTFGYNNLVVDFRSISIIQELTGCPVVFDATHSVQLPGGAGSASSGDRRFVGVLARAAVAAGCNALFMETHPNPDRALCDGPNMVSLSQLETILPVLLRLRAALEEDGS